MATLWNRAGHYVCMYVCMRTFITRRSYSLNSHECIIFLSCGFFFLSSSFFLAYSQPSHIGCLPYFHTWCGLSANLEYRSDNVLHARLVENTGRKKSTKFRHLGTIAQLCWAASSQLRHISTIEKNLLNSNISSRCFHNMVNFGPLTAEICSGVWGIPANFNGFSRLAFVPAARSLIGGQPNFEGCLAVS